MISYEFVDDDVYGRVGTMRLESRWLSHCVAFAKQQNVPDSFLHILDAFGPGSHPNAIDAKTEDVATFAPLLFSAEHFLALESGLPLLAEELSQGISTLLLTEVDENQAVMFSRRFRSVFELLSRGDTLASEVRLLRVGLVCRVAEVLCGPRPQALRVRALCDFYYSQGALVFHQERASVLDLPSLEGKLQDIVWRHVSPGYEQAHMVGPTQNGPVSVNLLRARNPRWEARDSRTEPRSSFPQWVVEQEAVAGVSGGFFLYSEMDIAPPSLRTDPVGLLVHHGIVQNPPVFARSSLLLDEKGNTELRQVGMKDVSIAWDTNEVIVEAINDWEAIGDKVVLFHRAWMTRLPAHNVPSFSAVGCQVVESGHGIVEIPLAGYIVLLPPSSNELPFPGSSVCYHLPRASNGAQIQEAMAGGPMLLDEDPHSPPSVDPISTPNLVGEDFAGTAPPVTFSQDETFDQNLLPRMVVGVTRSGFLIFAAIDGRNFHIAPGMTLRGAAEMMRSLGCYRVINLDGGSSKRMVIQGESVDLSTTEVVHSDKSSEFKTHIRHVNSALEVSMILEAVAHSLKGPNHRYNEDRYRILNHNVPLVEDSEKGHLFGVMDGVGGAPMGMKAAQCVADSLLQFYREDAYSATYESLLQLLHQTNQLIHGWGMMPDRERPLGAAAATIMWFSPDYELYVLHAGDTRGYHCTGAGLRCVTRDHQEGKVLQRYLGLGESLRFDLHKAVPEESDRFVLVSDGVTKVLTTAEMGSILDEFETPKRVAVELVERARRKGSKDDATALVIELEEW